MAAKPKKDPLATLMAIPGVGKATAQKLSDAGIKSAAGINKAGAKGLANAGISAAISKKLLAAVAKNTAKKATTKAKSTAKSAASKTKAAAAKAKTSAKKTATNGAWQGCSFGRGTFSARWSSLVTMRSISGKLIHVPGRKTSRRTSIIAAMRFVMAKASQTQCYDWVLGEYYDRVLLELKRRRMHGLRRTCFYQKGV